MFASKIPTDILAPSAVVFEFIHSNLKSRFLQVQVLLNVLAVSQQPLTRGQLFDCVKTSSVTMMREDFNRRFQLLKEVLVPVKGALDGNDDHANTSQKSSRAAHARMRFMFFHHSFAEWLVDVKHCTQKYLCSAPEGHAMIAMWHTRRARKLTADEVIKSESLTQIQSILAYTYLFLHLNHYVTKITFSRVLSLEG